ncbi:amino acid permease 8-like [Aristolochia californica]|uniref:amino acid permease 8-like n=1 Tax=Aristolochia californica TaxID=171875 RepID=UPI0035E0BDA6
MEIGDDDGRTRTGTLWTATAHAVTAILGSGVLALPWSVAQLGWALGPVVLIAFAFVTYYTAILLSDCYRYPGPLTGRRNYTYIDVVRSYLRESDVLVCGFVQYALLWGTMIGYTITAAMSMISLKYTSCYRDKGSLAECGAAPGNTFMIIFGAMEIILSQFPNLEKIAVLSVVASATSFAYSFIGLYLCAQFLISNHEIRGSLFGEEIGANGISSPSKVWHEFQALGNIAFAYTYSMLLIEIQDTIKSPPSENKTMKKASVYGIGITTLFYASVGCVGYAAFGNKAPGNILTGFYQPFWLVLIAHLSLIIHLAGAYQVFAQPIFAIHEKWLSSIWPSASFFHKSYTVRLPFTKARSLQFRLSKLLFRTAFVILSTFIAMMFPFFNAIVGLLGSIAFWPLTIYFPVSMHIAQVKIKRGSCKWMALQTLSMFSLLVTIVGAIGSAIDIVENLKQAKLFKFVM